MGKRHDLPALGAVSSPGSHQLPAFLKEITASIRSLDLVTNGVTQCHFDDVICSVGGLTGPVSERGSETVNRAGFTHFIQPTEHRTRPDWFPVCLSWKQVIVAFEPRQVIQQINCRIG